MKFIFEKYPFDIILFILFSIILLPIVLLGMDEILRIIVGIPFIFFVPGYMLIFILYPTKKIDNGIDGIERLTLSIGFSIAIVSLLGLMLNFTPLGIRVESVLLLLFFISESLGLIALYRWKTIPPDQRFIITVDLNLFKSNNIIDKILSIILIISIFIASAIVIYIIITPKKGEVFTEFYILGQNRNSTNYPRDIIIGENTSVILGLVNHEYETMNYTIEIWLINETTFFNKSTQKNDSIINHAWFMDKIFVRLNSITITTEAPWKTPWEYNYTFAIKKIGNFKLNFLLFTTPEPEYSYGVDYHDIINQSIKDAYRDVHLWLYVGYV